MADTIDVPGLGATKKTTLYAVGVGAVLVVGVVYYRSKKQAAAAQAASVTQAGTNATDPATGYPYGSPEDAAALSTQASYYQANQGGYGDGYSGGSPGTGSGSTGFVSNAAWAQAYEQYAVNNVQANATTVAAALGKYLTGQPLSADQLNIVEQAIAFEGLPPIAGTNGYPPSYQLQQTPTPTPSTIPDGYYAINAQGGIVYHVKGNKVWHVTKSTWQRLNPKPGVIEVDSGWLQRIGIPFMGDE